MVDTFPARAGAQRDQPGRHTVEGLAACSILRVGEAMKDLLRRLKQATPRFLSWMQALHRTHAEASRSVSQVASPRLRDYWPREHLDSSRVVIVDEIPFPPVSEYGLPEFESMAAMSMAGITFGDMYFLKREHAIESVHTHELVHVIQWGELGPEEFLLTYALGIAQHGYRQSPFESAAYEVQREFDAGRAVPDLLDSVRAHARKQRDGAEGVFRDHGLVMSV